MMTTSIVLKGRVPHVIFLTKLRFTSTFQEWLEAHEANTAIRNGCCDETKTLIFRSVTDTAQGIALLLEDVDYDAFKKYLLAMSYGKLAIKTEAFLLHRRLPAGLPSRCLARCLGYLVPIHGHFIGLWTIEEDYNRWFAYHSSSEMTELRSGFGAPIDLYQGVNDTTKVLGLAADINWKACMRFLGAGELYDSIPAARRAGELDFIVWDGAKVDREKDLLGAAGAVP